MPHLTLTPTNWLFMGVGAALFYGASQMRRVFMTAGRAGMRGRTVPGAGALSALRPRDIRAAIKQAPVMQQERAANAYKGAAVCWQVSFESAFASGPFTLRLMCQDQDD